MTLVPPLPDTVDHEILRLEAAEVAATGGITFYVGEEVLTYSSDGTSVRSEIGIDTGATAIRLRIPRVFVHPFRLNPYTDSGVFVHPAGG